MNGGKKPANTGSGSPVRKGGEDVTASGTVRTATWRRPPSQRSASQQEQPRPIRVR